jgi:glutamyl-tRNA synthetase
MVRVRFAPSPTGFLHIGSLRTALYNSLFAKGHSGVCVLRIEDTDRTRFVPGAMEEQIESLRWAGIEFDEGPHIGGQYGPYVQSERFDIYAQYGMQLIENGSAYYAFDTAEELDAMRQRQQAAGIAPKYDRSSMRNQYTLGEHETQRLLGEHAEHVIRLKVPLHSDIRFHDAVRGEVIVHGREIDDQILLKSDGFPTYHLANVVDDHLMEISHVIRAEEWLPSTPKHILLYEAFGWELPVFAHVPLLLNADRSKMSKRHGDVMVKDFIARGYFPDALVNYVALCGWNPGTEQEVFSRNALETMFSLERVSKAGAIFDYKKLDWMNTEYLKATPLDVLADNLVPMLVERKYEFTTAEFVKNVIGLLRERVTFLSEIVEFGDYFFSDSLNPLDAETESQLINNTQLKQALQVFRDDFSETVLASHEAFTAHVQAAAKASELKMGAFLKPLRQIITHRNVGAELFDTMHLLGMNRCIARINTFLS